MAICTCLLMLQGAASATLVQDTGAGRTFILYYSKTGNTRAACEALQKALNADIKSKT